MQTSLVALMFTLLAAVCSAVELQYDDEGYPILYPQHADMPIKPDEHAAHDVQKWDRNGDGRCELHEIAEEMREVHEPVLVARPQTASNAFPSRCTMMAKPPRK